MQQSNSKCPIHQQRNIIGFCVSKSCKNNRVCCLKCLNEFHNDHTKDVIEQDEVQQLIEKNRNSLETVLYQITELESVLRMIKLSYQSLIKNTPTDLDNSQFLIDQIETVLKTDDTQLQVCLNQFESTKKQIGKYAECIFNFKMNEYEFKENIEKLNQVKELVKQKGFSKSMQVLENLLDPQTYQSMPQLSKIQSLITTIFSDQVIEKKQDCQKNFQFTHNLFPKSLQISKDFRKIEQTETSLNGIALISPNLSRTGSFKIQFKVCKQQWIGLGLCKKDIVVKTNYSLDKFESLGHGCYMISANSYKWNNHNSAINGKIVDNFTFTTNDIISVTVNNGTITWNHETKKIQHSMPIELDDDTYFCVGIYGKGNIVEIID